MLDQETRQAILALKQRGHSIRAIGRALGIARDTVRDVLKAGVEIPPFARSEKVAGYRDRIVELYQACGGNLVRVHEELVREEKVHISYPAFTAFCRRYGIGQEPKRPAGHYHFEPGQEMQHDTSPHDVSIGGKVRRVQTASLVLCYSRILFFQFYPQFRRFECKLFLTDAARYMDGACQACMIDNTHVVVLSGTGKDMVPVPEMEAFGKHLGFAFAAHERGHANRKGRVERPFRFIENNFLARRTFTSWADANEKARAWCDQVNATYKKHLRAIPRALYAVERPAMRRLPIWVPDPYLLHERIVDVDGDVCVHTNRYSAPPDLIGRRVEVRETRDRIVIYLGTREVTWHPRQVEPLGCRISRPEHRAPRGEGRRRRESFPEIAMLSQALPEVREYVSLLKKRGKLQTTLALRRLLRMANDYPPDPLRQAVRTACHYGMVDLDRLERMVLRTIAQEYFLLPIPDGGDDDPTNGGAPAAPQVAPPEPDRGDPA
ncbi:MAG: helix-turn-helix domain-containing protein [Acidobacteriota bacterium]